MEATMKMFGPQNRSDIHNFLYFKQLNFTVEKIVIKSI